MNPWTTGIGLGVGTLQGLQKEKQAERDRQLQAQTALWSPWTGMAPQAVKEADLTSQMIGGGTAGFEMGQNIAQSKAQEAINKSQLAKDAAQIGKLGAEQSAWEQMALQRRMRPTGVSGPLMPDDSYYTR